MRASNARPYKVLQHDTLPLHSYLRATGAGAQSANEINPTGFMKYPADMKYAAAYRGFLLFHIRTRSVYFIILKRIISYFAKGEMFHCRQKQRAEPKSAPLLAYICAGGKKAEIIRTYTDLSMAG